ncbi:NAD(P)H-hydrate dehydratase [Haloferax volcanii]|uniref:NAD(P)H-hydrate dehydratase n=1 Tax=Haloferax volcanii TaxID=2246 RepID=UPI0023DC127F|nr:NAD(P)H-hydrate dehydratase [Haloferax lucentense]WEL25625.1 NAD(P)H-hydrate repair enzyme Nnr, NAD(P)H-hydrate dehydratase domain [Haloferax lucentense]
MITSRRMAAVDLNAEALGVPRKQLMESSGNAVARACRDLADPGASVAVVAGRGNNGGDALVAARFLKAYDVTVHLLGRPETISTDIARENWDALVAGEADRRTVTDSAAVDLGDPDLVVDAMLGTGVTGALREPEATAARAINESSATVLAVDVPSGVDADTGDAAGLAVDADRVVTFHDDKPGLGDLDCEVVVADIGIPEAAELFTGPGDLLALDRDAQSHKGDHGDVLVVGGGPYTGAPALAAQSALRAGADLARVACPETVAREVQGYSENLIVRGFSGDRLAPEHVPDLLDFAADRDAVVLGPGLGDADESLAAVREFLAAYEGTAVVDADALQVVPEVDTEATLICTPHQGELRKMGGETDADWETRSDLVREFAADLGHTLLVKGAYDVVSDGDAVRVNRTGNPGMTVGGTGDVLAGTTGALAAVLPPLDAAAVAAYANGRAGDLAADEFGGGLVATDLLERLPAALRGDDE